jgi:hypothetical protein
MAVLVRHGSTLCAEMLTQSQSYFVLLLLLLLSGSDG